VEVVEAGAARAAQRRRVIGHEVPVPKSRRKPTPQWRGGLSLTVLRPNRKLSSGGAK
jgi:hypothetical protein